MLLFLFLLLNGLVTYVVVRSTVKALLGEERRRLLSDLEKSLRSIGQD